MGKLIRLELFNFKSYKGHHSLLFGDAYFTSIIGPNGSGKSNSMDAISFVLGIKSSHLRSSQLKDLIYRGRVLGTAKINSDGSAVESTPNGSRATRDDPKTAWVMAVYEDDAGDEQRWKRTITSSGASEYRINNRVVTAQQYNDALESENILIKARNFLVFQGDVEAIASQDPQQLTRLVEQISGSVEYKAEYERLQSEVDKATENQADKLHRRRGINSEIKQFQEQKKEAENFQKKADDRDAMIVKLKLWKIFHLQKKMNEAGEEMSRHNENLKEFRRNLDAARKKLEDARKEQLLISKEAGKIDKEAKARQKTIEDKESQLVPIEEKVQQSKSRSSEIQKRIDQLAGEYETVDQDIKKSQKDLTVVEKARKQFEDEWNETIKKTGKTLSEADHRQYQTIRQQVVAQAAADQAHLDTLQRQLKSDEVAVNGLRGKSETIASVIEKLRREIAGLDERKADTSAAVQDLTTAIEQQKYKLNELRSARVEADEKRRELEEQLIDTLNKMAESNDSRNQNEREREAKERVINLKRMFPGVKGRVSDTCKPKQRKYEQAIITAMGPNFDAVIVDSIKTGNDCIQHLKDQRLPRMTFIPLDNIKTSPVNSAVKGIQGAKLAIDVIDFDAALERAISYACGGAVICESFEIAKHIVHDRKLNIKAVDLVGNVVHKNGLMTGGRGPENKGRQRRFETHDIQNLEKVAFKIRDDIARLPRPDYRDNQEEDVKNELDGSQQRLRFAQSELAAFEKNVADKMKQLQHEEHQLAGIQSKLHAAAADLEKSQAEAGKSAAAVAKVEDRLFADFCKRLGYADIRAYEAQQGSLQEAAAEKRTNFEVQREKLTSNMSWQEKRREQLIERQKHLVQNLERLSNDMKEYERQKKQINASVAKEAAAVDLLAKKTAELQAQLQAKADAVAIAKAAVQERTKEIETRTKSVAALETEVAKLSASLFDQLRRCKMDQIQLPLSAGSLDHLDSNDALMQDDPDAMDVDGEEDNVQVKTLEDYGVEIDFDSLDSDLKETEEPDVEDQLQDKISTINAELEHLNPNMRATKSLEAVEARLKATEREFEEARATLKEVRDAFSDIKQKRFELFNRAFTHIQAQIGDVYRELTASDAAPIGGSAYLDVEDTDTPYLTGIKYTTMPPFKRYRDIEHLSGGEKTMAALALLFAVHSFQPSPFFVLDEVDAALDNANVAAIKKYIADHAGPGMQFIVISLKAGLFQDSQSLIGVYRDQDVNSSRTLTLDLRQYA